MAKLKMYDITSIEGALVKAEAGGDLRRIPYEFRTIEVCRAAITNNPLNFGAAPYSLKTPEFCEESIKASASNLSNVPQYLRSAELCNLAVRQSSSILGYVPIAHRTIELCRIAAENGCNLESVPEEHRTEEICMLALTNCKDYLRSLNLKCTPEAFRAQVEQSTAKKAQPAAMVQPTPMITKEVSNSVSKTRHSFGSHIEIIGCNEDAAAIVMNKILSGLGH